MRTRGAHIVAGVNRNRVAGSIHDRRVSRGCGRLSAWRWRQGRRRRCRCPRRRSLWCHTSGRGQGCLPASQLAQGESATGIETLGGTPGLLLSGTVLQGLLQVGAIDSVEDCADLGNCVDAGVTGPDRHMALVEHLAVGALSGDASCCLDRPFELTDADTAGKGDQLAIDPGGGAMAERHRPGGDPPSMIGRQIKSGDALPEQGKSVPELERLGQQTLTPSSAQPEQCGELGDGSRLHLRSALAGETRNRLHTGRVGQVTEPRVGIGPVAGCLKLITLSSSKTQHHRTQLCMLGDDVVRCHGINLTARSDTRGCSNLLSTGGLRSSSCSRC